MALLIFALGAGIAQAATAAAAQPSAGYSAPQLYNQANADARDGKPGMAVLNYERARLLAPYDPDIRANLNSVRETSGLPAVNGSWFERVVGLASPNTLFWLGCIGIVIAGASELARRLYPRRGMSLRAATAAGLSLIILTLGSAAAVWPAMNEAVVIAPTTPERLAPASIAEPLTTLREAQIVTVEAERQDFALVHTTSGQTGWVARADLASIVPHSS
jgi:hypothetical protein